MTKINVATLSWPVPEGLLQILQEIVEGNTGAVIVNFRSPGYSWQWRSDHESPDNHFARIVHTLGKGATLHGKDDSWIAHGTKILNDCLNSSGSHTPLLTYNNEALRCLKDRGHPLKKFKARQENKIVPLAQCRYLLHGLCYLGVVALAVTITGGYLRDDQ